MLLNRRVQGREEGAAGFRWQPFTVGVEASQNFMMGLAVPTCTTQSSPGRPERWVSWAFLFNPVVGSSRRFRRLKAKKPGPLQRKEI